MVPKEMFIMVAFLVVPLVSTTDEDIPAECIEGNYKNLGGINHEHRHFNYRDTSGDRDNTLNTVDEYSRNHSVGFDNWFRFRSQDRMMEMSELKRNIYNDTSLNTFSPCGTIRKSGFIWVEYKRDWYYTGTSTTTNIYTLTEPHPKEKYGLIFSYSIGCYYETIKGPVKSQCNTNFVTGKTECDWTRKCPTKSTVPIVVRNCGGFFVYKSLPIPKITGWFEKSGIFCGITANLPTVTEGKSECKNYRSINDEDDREWSAKSKKITTLKCQDDTTFLAAPFWIRFKSSIGETMQIAEDCPSTVEVPDSLLEHSYCGALYRGWIKGDHPTVNEGRTTRTLCFSEATSCKCDLASQLEITNCGDFYVYRRQRRDFPHCFARACTTLDQRSIIKRTTTTTTTTTTTIQPTTSNNTNNSSNTVINIQSKALSSSSIDLAKASVFSSQQEIMSSSAAEVVMQTMPVRSVSSISMFSVSESTTIFSSSIHPSTSIQNIPQSSPILPPITPPKKKELDLCHKYETIIDDSRTVTNYVKLTKQHQGCDLKYHRAVRFLSTHGHNLKIKESCTRADQFNKRCSTSNANVWLTRPHPKEGSSAVEVYTVCLKPESNSGISLFDLNYCRCGQQEFILVQRCVDNQKNPFFVYQLQPLLRNSNTPSLRDKQCKMRYCMEEGEQGTIGTTAAPGKDKPKEVSGLSGQFTIKKPFVNDAPLSQKDIEDETSDTYKFLVETLKKKIISSLLNEAKNITRIEITKLGIGSLVVDYEVHGTDTLNNETLNKAIKKSFTDEPNVQTSTGANSFSGTIDPQSQKFTALDICATKPCHTNATCTNNVEKNTFSCKCDHTLEGDGFTCSRIIDRLVYKEKDNHNWSNDAIIIVAVMFSACLVVIAIMAFCLCSFKRGQMKSKSKDEFSNYISTNVQTKEKVPEAENHTMENLYLNDDINANNPTVTDPSNQQKYQNIQQNIV